MRLLNVSDFSFKEFWSPWTTPKYAILSHRWGDDEVSYKEWRKVSRTTGPGYEKIRNFCRTARGFGYEWVWVDTCCIDKRSSAELTEAINSMYAWYERASLCIVYLQDVGCKSHSEVKGALGYLGYSAWFTRGWTLQEILAPTNILFFSLEWTVLGRITAQELRSSDSLGSYSSIASLVASITGIDKYSLKDPKMMRRRSLAVKMSWAAKRQTSREEDMAYCLLGLFDVNMPLLYGEGANKAFMRLQLEIIKKSSDETIFAWRAPDHGTWYGLLAGSPRAFQHAGNISVIKDDDDENDANSVLGTHTNAVPRLPYSMTNRGLEFRARAWGHHRKHGTYYVRLECEERGDQYQWQSCMLVLRGTLDTELERVRDVYRKNTEDLGESNARQRHWDEVVRQLRLQDLGIFCFEVPQSGL